MSISKKNISLEFLLDTLKTKYPEETFQLLEEARKVAREHCEDFSEFDFSKCYSIPISCILIQLEVNTEVLLAGFLHGAGVRSTEFIGREFGIEVMALLNGVNDLDFVNQPGTFVREKKIKKTVIENLRKLIQEKTSEPGVLVIKLAEIVWKLRTLKHVQGNEQITLAKEARNLYAPLAGRLGVYLLKWELEDLAFSILEPNSYSELKKLVSEKREERDKYIRSILQTAETVLREQNIYAKIIGRAKHFYSIHKKMQSKHKNIKQIFDIQAIRIIVNSVEECYKALGLIHTLWSPIVGRFKDYIGKPKENMYQSIHTTVKDERGRTIEVQIRTFEMDRIAELGVAAHWVYKEGLKLQNNSESNGEVKETIVFTPIGKMIRLKPGSTVLDFAFKVHTQLGLHARGAIINQRMIPLQYKLQSGDKIEIIFDKKQKPSIHWLQFVRSGSARQKIRRYLKSLESEKRSEEQIFPPGFTGKRHLLLNGNKNRHPVKPKPPQLKESNTISIEGDRNILFRFASCCAPEPGDQILGYVTRGRGVTIHRRDCIMLRKNVSTVRLIDVDWDIKSYRESA
ncbi:MAG: bifunctional (p)ppGpp synthetase/guanosine-3',5'-bis(diphosphate) 3'-pyrophosphohydrolase [Leptospiraceae bacterium]|nr:bifunctional (p)ppGpp synthetase/guanosine-3',5'-bis(diphosphate) 3'-pyrophosphohydrolase [Leptospiraceae bacterium]